MNRYTLSPEAEADLDDIWLYVARDSVTTADRLRDGILDALDRLAEYPHSGHVREDIVPTTLRFWPVYSYEIIYRPDTDPLEIARILSGYRNLPRLLP